MFWKKTAAMLLALWMLCVFGACVARSTDREGGTIGEILSSESTDSAAGSVSGGESSAPAEETVSNAASDVSSTEPNTSSVESDASQTEETIPSIEEGVLTVHYLDVGQGDAIFLELPNGQCMLIDASEAVYSGRIIEAIRSLSYDRIDYVIATHPHADHIGGMKNVLNAFAIGCIYLPDVSASTATYIGMAETILDLEIEAKIAEAGVTLLSEGELHASFLAPIAIDDSDLNRNSAVLFLTYGETRFLFMGDADTTVEDALSGSIDCDVLKVGHHGSRTASGSGFLQRTSPAYAVISCGEGNSYGHPHAEAMQRLEACGVEILRTDLSGTIVIRSDGSSLYVETDGEQQEREPEESEAVTDPPAESSESSASGEEPEAAKWILNTSTYKIHRPDCRHVDSIAEKNRAESVLTIAELMQQGYTACGTCKPTDGTE